MGSLVLGISTFLSISRPRIYTHMIVKNTVFPSLTRQNIDQKVNYCRSCVISPCVSGVAGAVWKLHSTSVLRGLRRRGSLACSGPGSSLHLPFYSNSRCLAPTAVCHHTFLSTQDHKMLSGSAPASSWNFASFIGDGLNPGDPSSGFDLGSKC